MRPAWRAALLALAIAPAALAASKPKIDPKLVGNWGRRGETLFVFKADGSGKMEKNPVQWTADGQIVSMKSKSISQKMRYKIKGDRLLLTMGGETQEFERMKERKGLGKWLETIAQAAEEEDEDEPVARPAKKSGAARASGTPSNGSSDELSRLLLSSAWCSFSYNKVSGSSSSKRVVFSPDGSWSLGGQSEGYSSGYGGTMASQHGSEDSGRWKARGGQLFMSNAEEPSLSPVQLQVTRNSNGYPIINADGVEYSQCR